MSELRVRDLDPSVVGMILINSIAGASALGHKRLSSTLKDYADWDDEDSPPEAKFVRDAITRPIPEVVAEWFGGAQEAHALAVDVAFDGCEPPPLPRCYGCDQAEAKYEAHLDHDATPVVLLCYACARWEREADSVVWIRTREAS